MRPGGDDSRRRPTDGRATSAQAWFDSQCSEGDWSRRHVLDAPMLARVSHRSFELALDLACGEGRFCRLLQRLGIATVGVDLAVGGDA